MQTHSTASIFRDRPDVGFRTGRHRQPVEIRSALFHRTPVGRSSGSMSFGCTCCRLCWDAGGCRAGEEAGKGWNRVGPKLSTVFAEPGGSHSPGSNAFLHRPETASGGMSLNQDQVWSQVQEELRFQLAKRTYDMWLKNTSVLSADNNTYRIGVPSKLAKDWLADRFSGLIQETLQAVTGTEVDIDFVISPSGNRPSVATVEVENLSLAHENGHDKEADSFPDAPPIPPSELN